MQFIEYEKCSTCQKAKCFLKEHNLSFDERSIVNEVPSYDELKKWVLKYQIEIKKLFNTSGLKYRELEKTLKDKDIAKGEAELKVKNLQNEYTKIFEEQDKEINTLKKKFEEEGQNAVTNKVLLDEANEKLDKLNKIYDDCENEKLAIQADYESLNNKYHTIELDMVNKDEIIKSYQEQLNNENILRFNKEDINNLCDYVLDFFKDKNINDEE